MHPFTVSLPASARRRAVRQGGFTIIEMVVTLIIMAEVIMAVLLLFDVSNKINHVQLQVSDMQQSLRVAQQDIVRMARMVGRGGLRGARITAVGPPAVLGLPSSMAIEVRNNTPNATTNIAIGNAAADAAQSLVAAGTDVLTLRGVITSPIYQLAYMNAATYTLYDAAGAVTADPVQAATGQIKICDTSPVNTPQDGGPLRTSITNRVPEALIITASTDDTIYGVVELDPANSLTTSDTCGGNPGATIKFKTGAAITNPPPNGAPNVNFYRALSPALATERLPKDLTTVAFVGILEEYRYYIRQDTATSPIPGATELAPHLSRARLFPNTEQAYAGDTTNLRLDLADNVLDLQIALGIDKNGDSHVDDAANNTDEWLYNSPTDNADPLTGNWLAGRQSMVRVDTLARTEGREFGHISAQITAIEDRAYPAATGANSAADLMFRRRVVQTFVKLRNL